MDILRTHPMVLIGGIIQENPFFKSADEFLQELKERRSTRIDKCSCRSGNSWRLYTAHPSLTSQIGVWRTDGRQPETESRLWLLRARGIG